MRQTAARCWNVVSVSHMICRVRALIESMRAEHRPPQGSTPHNFTDMCPVEAVLAGLEPLEAENDDYHTKMAAKHSVSRST
jgi:hypothetical protein